MTWREAIEQACAGVREAEAERLRIFHAAHDAGLSVRVIAEAAGLTHSTVWRWMGASTGQPGARLDAEADIKTRTAT